VSHAEASIGRRRKASPTRCLHSDQAKKHVLRARKRRRALGGIIDLVKNGRAIYQRVITWIIGIRATDLI
jgi:hypothetical protein